MQFLIKKRLKRIFFENQFFNIHAQKTSKNQQVTIFGQEFQMLSYELMLA